MKKFLTSSWSLFLESSLDLWVHVHENSARHWQPLHTHIHGVWSISCWHLRFKHTLSCGFYNRHMRLKTLIYGNSIYHDLMENASFICFGHHYLSCYLISSWWKKCYGFISTPRELSNSFEFCNMTDSSLIIVISNYCRSGNFRIKKIFVGTTPYSVSGNSSHHRLQKYFTMKISRLL